MLACPQHLSLSLHLRVALSRYSNCMARPSKTASKSETETPKGGRNRVGVLGPAGPRGKLSCPGPSRRPPRLSKPRRCRPRRLHAAVYQGLKPPQDRHSDPGSRPPPRFPILFCQSRMEGGFYSLVGHARLQRQQPHATNRGARSPDPVPRGRKRGKGTGMKTRAFSSCVTLGLRRSQPAGTGGSGPGHRLCSMCLHKLPPSAT